MSEKRASLEVIAPTAEEAVAKGLQDLGLTEDAVEVEVLDLGSRGLFGIGARQARVRLTIRGAAAEAPRPSAPTADAPLPPRPSAPPAPKPMASAPAVSDADDVMPIPAPARDPKPAPRPAAPKPLEPRPLETRPQAEKPRVEKVPLERPRVERPPVERLPLETPAYEPAPAAPVGEEDEALRVARETVADLLEKMKVRAQVVARYHEVDEVHSRPTVYVDVRGNDLSVLIGPRSETLNALQYISALIVSKELGHSIALMVDVEGYRARREQQIRQLARRMAEQAIKTGRRQVLEPMTASERRLIHIELRANPDVITESVGDEPRRKVTVLPKGGEQE